MRVVYSIYLIVGIGLPCSWNISAEVVIVGMFLCSLDAIVSMKAEYLSWEMKVKACWPFSEKEVLLYSSMLIGFFSGEAIGAQS